MLARLVVLMSLAALAGCCRERVVTLPEDPAIRKALESIDPANDPLAMSTPIIDMHTHTFNARYLPIRGIALGKRDKFLFTRFIPDPVAIAFAEFISRTTELPDLPAASGQAVVQPLSVFDAASKLSADAKIVGESAPRHPLLTGAVKLAARDLAVDKRVQFATLDLMRDQAELLRRGVFDLNTSEREALAQMDELGKEGFLSVIRRSDAEMDALHQATYGPQVKLIVSHAMDLGPVYDQRAESNLFLDFPSQLNRYKHFQSQPGARTVYFVAYNPYRDHWNGGKPGDALDMVKDAIRNRGAFGVKVYPPSGYRPFANLIPEPPKDSISPYPGDQWHGRYGGVTNEQLDQRLHDLLEYCEANDIPVFAHCNTGEFEARSGYGRDMADPKWWKRYLDHHSRTAHNGKLCKLRLCLGHAGGGPFLFGKGLQDDFDWGELVLELCRTYPNVYCEIGVLDEILRDDRQAYFVGKLAGLLEAPQRREAFDLAKKIMYGTDWNMSTAISAGPEYLRKYQQALLHERLRNYYPQFFFTNAMEFLDVAGSVAEGVRPVTDQKRPVGNEVRARLAELLKQSAPIREAAARRESRAFMEGGRLAMPPAQILARARAMESTDKRSLTAGEIRFLRTIFGNAVPYRKVVVSRGNAFERFCDAVTIANKIHFSDSVYCDDFSAAGVSNETKALFAHEMTHVWQHNDFWQFYGWSRALNEILLYRDKVYCFDLDPNKKLTRYRFEQQGAIIQEYAMFLLEGSGYGPPQRRKDLEAVIYKSIKRP